jgi:hypothetical protein
VEDAYFMLFMGGVGEILNFHTECVKDDIYQ